MPWDTSSAGIPSDDLDLLISAINIQHEVGGNLAQILDVIGHTIRERVRIKGEIGVLTAQQTNLGLRHRRSAGHARDHPLHG